MKKWVCAMCGHVHESDSLSQDFVCPVCQCGAEEFTEEDSESARSGGMTDTNAKS